jgi:acetyltransferase
MSTYRLEKLFSPRSIAVVGGSPRATSPGRAVLRNLREAAFKGPLSLINPHYPEIEGVRSVKDIRDLTEVPDLLVIAVPAPSVPEIVAAAGEKGVAAAVVITAGLGHGPGSLAQRCEQAARASGLRLVGPNCLGVMAPRERLNASFAARMPPVGDLALISQSGAITAGLVEWSAVHGIGFSAVVSVGDRIDVDFGDLLETCSISLLSTAVRARFSFISNPSATRGSSCPRRARPRASSRWWW